MALALGSIVLMLGLGQLDLGQLGLGQLDLGQLGVLLGLSLVDSTSIGTLVIPIWLLLSPTPPSPRRILAYLAALTVFYAAVGLALVSLLRFGMDSVVGLLDSQGAAVAMFAVGVGLFVFSYRFDSRKRRAAGLPDRTSRWRERALQANSGRSLIVLALVAGCLELLTMLPYLAASAIIADASLAPSMTLLVVLGYCLVMVLPALILLALRSAMQKRLAPLLVSLDKRLSRYADTALGWVIGIVGVLLALQGLNRFAL